MEPDSHAQILVVDDDPSAVRLMCDLLLRAGYPVAAAAGGPEAIRVLSDAGGAVGLVVTDVMMPKADGRAVAAAAVAASPGAHVVYVSVLDKERLVILGRIEPEAAFIAKPYTPNDLISTVRLLIGDAPTRR